MFSATILKLAGLALLIVFLMSITGCGTTAPGRAAGVVVDRYCDASPEARALMRLEADAVTRPHKIRVHCVE